jgi:hypothetical protein
MIPTDFDPKNELMIVDVMETKRIFLSLHTKNGFTVSNVQTRLYKENTRAYLGSAFERPSEDIGES